MKMYTYWGVSSEEGKKIYDEVINFYGMSIGEPYFEVLDFIISKYKGKYLKYALFLAGYIAGRVFYEI